MKKSLILVHPLQPNYWQTQFKAQVTVITSEGRVHEVPMIGELLKPRKGLRRAQYEVSVGPVDEEVIFSVRAYGMKGAVVRAAKELY